MPGPPSPCSTTTPLTPCKTTPRSTTPKRVNWSPRCSPTTPTPAASRSAGQRLERPAATRTRAPGRGSLPHRHKRRAGAEDLGGDDDFEFDDIPTLVPTGGFRWEYDNAIATLNDDYSSRSSRCTRKSAIRSSRRGLIIDLLARTTTRTTTPTTISPNRSRGRTTEIRDIEEQIEVWTQTALASANG